MNKKTSVTNGKFTLRQFNYRFPDDDACLEAIKLARFGNEYQCPKCHVIGKFYHIKGRTAYACGSCRHQIYPLKGTIFEKTTTPLKDWFYAMYVMVQTRAGISAKTLQRELGNSYKTSWRMFHQIRELMADDGDMLTGKIEIDEGYVGGAGYWRAKERKDLESNKSVVFGMVERGGRVKAIHVPSSGARALLPEVQKHIAPNSKIYSDEYGAYKTLPRLGYKHGIIRHKDLQFVKGDIHTQTIENYWSNMKRGITGVYRHVSSQHLQKYANEYAFRYSNREKSLPICLTRW